MAIFPELIPSTRTYSPGAFPHTAHLVYDGSEARVRHSNTVLGARLRLFFPALSTADLLTVIAHYTGQRGRFLPFVIPDEILSGTTTPADFTPVGHQWRYAARPTVEDISIVGGTNVHNLTIELETVPPENTIAQGARLRARASLRAGSAQLGEFFEVLTLLDPGAVSTQLDLLASVIFEPGSPFPVVTFDVVATLEAGAFIWPTPGELFVTATLAAGAASSPVTDPDFASVDLLLPLDAADGTTTFTDFSPSPLTLTTAGNARIRTAWSKWGGSAGYCDGTGDHATISSPSATLREWWNGGAYSIEAWIRMDAVPFSIGSPLIGNMDPSSNIQWWSFGPNDQGSGGKLIFRYWNGSTNQVTGTTTMTTGVDYFIQLIVSGTTIELRLDGALEATATVSGTPQSSASQPLTIGQTDSNCYNGYFDDVRITPGVARPTTVPTAAFPTS